MAEPEQQQQQKIPTLAEEWSLPEKVQQTVQSVVQSEAPVEKTAEEKPSETTADTVVEEKTEDVSAADESTPAEENNATTEAPEITEAPEEAEAEEVAEDQTEIKIETAPADFRFPTTNQTRHCFTRYIEYHRCVAAKGEDSSECNKFAKYYRSLCPGEWVDRWNEQRENGTFPGPL